MIVAVQLHIEGGGDFPELKFFDTDVVSLPELKAALEEETEWSKMDWNVYWTAMHRNGGGGNYIFEGEVTPPCRVDKVKVLELTP